METDLLCLKVSYDLTELQAQWASVRGKKLEEKLVRHYYLKVAKTSNSN